MLVEAILARGATAEWGSETVEGRPVADVEGSDGFAEDDDPLAPRPSSLADAVPPVRWPLSLLAGVCCGVGAAWASVTSGPSRAVVVASVAAVAWLAFAVAWLALRRVRQDGQTR